MEEDSSLYNNSCLKEYAFGLTIKKRERWKLLEVLLILQPVLMISSLLGLWLLVTLQCRLPNVIVFILGLILS